MAERIRTMRQFVEQVYVPDVKAVAGFYPEWWSLGAGHKNYLSYGALQQGNRTDESQLHVPARDHPRRRPRHGPSRRPGEDHRVDRPQLLRLRRRRPGDAPPVRRRDEPELHGPAAAVPGAATSTTSTAGSSRRATTASRWRSARSRGCSSRTAPGTSGCRSSSTARSASSSSSRRRSSPRSAASRPGRSRRSTCST